MLRVLILTPLTFSPQKRPRWVKRSLTPTPVESLVHDAVDQAFKDHMQDIKMASSTTAMSKANSKRHRSLSSSSAESESLSSLSLPQI